MPVNYPRADGLSCSARRRAIPVQHEQHATDDEQEVIGGVEVAPQAGRVAAPQVTLVADPRHEKKARTEQVAGAADEVRGGFQPPRVSAGGLEVD